VDLLRSEDPATRGKLPFPESLKKRTVKFTPLDEGGLGFVTTGSSKKKQRLSLSIASSSTRILFHGVVFTPLRVTTNDREATLNA
jgi:hypothetical protein